jgi:hypothetical protein
MFAAPSGPEPGTPECPWPEAGQMWVAESGIRFRVRCVRGNTVLCGYVSDDDGDLRYTTNAKTLMKKRFVPADRELELLVTGSLKEIS